MSLLNWFYLLYFSRKFSVISINHIDLITDIKNKKTEMFDI